MHIYCTPWEIVLDRHVLTHECMLYTPLKTCIAMLAIAEITSFLGCFFKGVSSTTRRSVEHCTPHTDGAWLNELG